MTYCLYLIFLLFFMLILSVEKKKNHIFIHIEDDKYLYIIETTVLGFCIYKERSRYVNRQFMTKMIIQNHYK